MLISESTAKKPIKDWHWCFVNGMLHSQKLGLYKNKFEVHEINKRIILTRFVYNNE